MPIDPFLGSVGLGAGASLFDALFPSKDPLEQFNIAGLESIQRNLGTEAVNVDELRSKAIAATLPELLKFSQGVAKKKGADTGAGKFATFSELGRLLSDFDLNRAPGIQFGNAQLNLQRGRTLGLA